MRRMTAVAAAMAFGMPTMVMASTTWDPSLDIVHNLPTFTLSGGAGGPTNSFEYTINTTGLGVTGFSFSGDYDEVVAGSWAADTRLRVYLNNVEVAHIGGFTSQGAPWDFQGSGSNNPGHYAHGINGSAPNGDGNPDWSIKGLATGNDTWRFEFTNGYHSSFTGDHIWSNGQIIIHQIPAPGALALLGLAGMVGSRRRR